jgi:hypothetical protein
LYAAVGLGTFSLMRYATKFTDEQIVQALKRVAASGVKREFAGDRLQPPNMAAFFANIPRPERDRLLGLVYSMPTPKKS